MKKSLFIFLVMMTNLVFAQTTVDYKTKASQLFKDLAKEAKVPNNDLRELKIKGANVTKKCTDNDQDCLAVKLGTTAVKKPTIEPYVPDEADEAGQCNELSVKVPVVKIETKKCAKYTYRFASDVVANAQDAMTGNLSHAAFLHLGAFSNNTTGKKYQSSNKLYVPEKHSTWKLILKIIDIGSIESIKINNTNVSIAGIARKHICYEIDPSCQVINLTMLYLNISNDVTYLIRQGQNSIDIVHKASATKSSGVLFALYPPIIETLLLPYPLCNLQTKGKCEYTEIGKCALKYYGICFLHNSTVSCKLTLKPKLSDCLKKICIDGNCTNPNTSSSNSKDLANAIARLESGRQMANYFDSDKLEVFTGISSSCRADVAWGLGSCCKADPSSWKTNNKQTLIQLGVTQAVSQVATIGSPHTHDVLFLNDDLQRSLKGLGQGQLVSLLSPSLSYYGLQVSIAKGAISFGFDPASFGIAIALAVLAQLLECSPQEKIVSMKLGADLCFFTRRWCSKRRFFFCKERSESYCCFNSKIAKTFVTQGKTQLGLPDSYCGGFSVNQIETIDFEEIDLSSLISDFNVVVDEQILNSFKRNNETAIKDLVTETAK